MEYSSVETQKELHSLENRKCPKCNRILKSAKVLRDHLRYCDKTLFIQCELCPFITKYNANLKIHMKTIHSKPSTKDEGTEECSNCAKRYKNLRCLKMHQRICKKPLQFECNDCLKKFRTKSNLNNHIRRMHLKVDVNGEIIGANQYLQCNECPYKTKHKDDLKRHLIKHCGYCEANCPKCGRKYKNHGYLKKHLKYCQRQTYECQRCSFKSHSKSNLKNHFNRMHVESQRFECFDCGKSYKYRYYVIRHIEYHCGREPHLMCEFCPFMTRYSHSLKVHRLNMHLKDE